MTIAETYRGTGRGTSAGIRTEVPPVDVRAALDEANWLLVLADAQAAAGRSALHGKLINDALLLAAATLERALRACLALGQEAPLTELVARAWEIGLLPDVPEFAPGSNLPGATNPVPVPFWEAVAASRDRVVRGNPNDPAFGPATPCVVTLLLDAINRICGIQKSCHR